MIEEAFISGQLGKAIYLEGQRYFQIDVDDSDAPLECYPMDLSKFLAFGGDFKTLSNGPVIAANLKQQLVSQYEERRALTLTISGMDRILDHESRMFAIMTAQGLTEKAPIHHFLRARLLARPAPPEADLETAIAIATDVKADTIRALYQFVLDQDLALALVYETWGRAAYDHFSSHAETIKTQEVFTDLGVFADMTFALATNNMKALNSLVVTYGRKLHSSDDPSRGVHLLNDLKVRLLKEWSPSNKRDRKRAKFVADFEETTSTNDLSRELITHFGNKQEKPKRKTFTADEAKEKVDHQIAAISKLITQGNTHRATKYLHDLINFHVEHSQREHLGMSLCSLAKVAIDTRSFELAETLVDYSLMLGIDDVVIFNTQAEMYKSMGDFDKALALYEETIQRFPNSVVTRSGYAEVLRATGDFDKALALYEETIQRFPNSVFARNGYAEVLRATGDFDKALAFYEETIQRFPSDVFARNGYAEVLRATGDFDKALALYEETIQRFPSDVFARNGYAELLRATGDFDKALAFYEETIQRFPNDVVARNGYAEVLRATGDFDKSVAFYEETIQRFPNDVFARNGYAELLRATGDFDKALAFYEETIERFPNSVVARNGYAEVLRATGDFDKALALYEETIQRFPNSVVTRSGYAEVLRATGDFDKALVLYEETIQRFPSDVVARNGYAELLRATGDFDKALALYEETIQRFPSDVVARNGYAEVLRATGDFDKALALYEETIQHFPSDVFARNGYAEVLRATGDFDKALAFYEETIQRFPNDVFARNGYAEVLRATGDFDKALAFYEETIQRFPNDVVARNGFASVLLLMNKFDEARSILPTTPPRSLDDWIAYHINAMSYLREGNVEEAIRRLTYALDKAWPSEKKYFVNALAVAKIRKSDFADIPQLLPLDAGDIDFAQRQTRLVLVGHSQAALGYTDEAAKTIGQLKSAQNPQVTGLAEVISRRYGLGKYSSLTLSQADINLLESTIYDQEFRLAA